MTYVTTIDKRGELTLENVLKIVIAVICIILLLMLAVSIWGIFLKKTRMEQAKANLDELSSIIEKLGENESFKYTLISPDGYILVGFPLERNEALPSKCGLLPNRYCLCFCEDFSGSGNRETIVDNCGSASSQCIGVNNMTRVSSENYFDKYPSYKDKYSILVDDLLKYKRNVILKRENGEYSIKPEEK